MKFKASNDDGFVLELLDDDLEKFKRTSLWKIRLSSVRRRAKSYDGQRILFGDLSSYEQDEIMDILQDDRAGNNDIVLDDAYQAIHEAEREYLKERSKVGLAIKSHAEDILDAFGAYADIVNTIIVRPLREMQMWDSFFMCTMRKSANFSVPGSGKTASTLGVFGYLYAKDLTKRIVVISPKNAFGSWRDEWASCFGSNIACSSLCFHDPEFQCYSAAQKAKELSLNYARYNLFLLNYEALCNFENELRNIISTETLLVFDEIHKVKKIGGIRAQSALEISRDAKFVIALTGTPIPNSYSDIYNLLNILYPNEYESFFGFSPKRLLDPDDETIALINSRIQPFFCRTNKKSLGVPDCEPDKIYSVNASSEENELLLALRQAYENDQLALIIRILQMESDPTMLGNALDSQDFDGFFEAPLQEDKPIIEPRIPTYIIRNISGYTTKTEACVDLATSLCEEGKPVIIWCFFRQSMHNLSDAIRNHGFSTEIIDGAVDQNTREQILGRFKGHALDVLITNPHTLAESVSLHSVCHDAIYFEYSYNLVHLLQSKDRIHRLGLAEDQYTQYHFMQTHFAFKGKDWSLDERIYDRLLEKEDIMLEAIDKGILEVGSVDEDDLKIVFAGLFDQ